MPLDLTEYPPDFGAMLNEYNNDIERLSISLQNGEITLDEWNGLMERSIAKYTQTAFLLGSGSQTIPPTKLQMIKTWFTDQLEYLKGFRDVISAAGGGVGDNFNPAWTARARMYGAATYSQYWEGATEDLPLPAQPGQGTQCLCITTPESRIMTNRGLVAIKDIKVGDLVITHLKRWKTVTATYLRLSRPDHRQAWVTSPWGVKVGCTSDHKFMTMNGWREVKDIDSGIDFISNYPNESLFKTMLCLDLERQQEYWTPTFLDKYHSIDANIRENTRFTPEVSLAEMLHPGSVLYDIEVEDDHSFIIEGLVSHNSNCRCRWEIVWLDKEKGDANAFWRLSPVENCQTCLIRSQQWNPVRIRGGMLL